MAAFDAPRAAYASVDLFGRFGQVFASVYATVAAWNDVRVTRNALSQLSDRELDDIGLCRGDIDLVVGNNR